jgi:cell division protein FtsL
VDNRHAFWVFKVIVGVAIALVPLAVYLLQTMSYVETSYAIESVRASEARLTDAERRLTIEKAALESLPAVEQRAGAQLKLEHPTASRVVVVAPAELGRSVTSDPTSHRPPSR